MCFEEEIASLELGHSPGVQCKLGPGQLGSRGPTVRPKKCLSGAQIALNLRWIVPLKLSFRCVWPQDGHLCPFWFEKSPDKMFNLLPDASFLLQLLSVFSVLVWSLHDGPVFIKTTWLHMCVSIISTALRWLLWADCSGITVQSSPIHPSDI